MREVLSLAAGGAFALGWFAFIDGLVIHASEHVTPPVPTALFVPGFVASLALVMICCSPVRRLDLFADGGAASFASSSSSLSCARAWLFCAFTMVFTSIGAAALLTDSMRFSRTEGPGEGEGESDLDVFVGSGGGGGVESDESAHMWTGFSAVLQCGAISISALLWVTAQLQERSL